MVSGFDPFAESDIVFIPIGVNYDRVLEDRLLTEAAARVRAGGRGSFKISSKKLFGFVANSIWLMLRGRWYRYGYACVSFGKPVSLRAYLGERRVDLRTLSAEAREAEIARLGELLMRQIARTVPALPVSLVTWTMLEDPERGLTAFELKGRVFELMQRLEAQGAYIHIPRRDREYAIDVGVRMLLLRRLIVEADDQYRINPAETALLAFYANAIAPLAGPSIDQPAKPPPAAGIADAVLEMGAEV